MLLLTSASFSRVDPSPFCVVLPDNACDGISELTLYGGKLAIINLGNIPKGIPRHDLLKYVYRLFGESALTDQPIQIDISTLDRFVQGKPTLRFNSCPNLLPLLKAWILLAPIFQLLRHHAFLAQRQICPFRFISQYFPSLVTGRASLSVLPYFLNGTFAAYSSAALDQYSFLL